MKQVLTIYALLLTATIAMGQGTTQKVNFDFYGDRVSYISDAGMYIKFNDQIRTSENVSDFLSRMEKANFSSVFNALNNYRKNENPDDWMFYQLVRKLAETLSPKAANYWQYTLYKFFLMYKSGYDPILAINNKKIVFFIQSNDNIYNMLFRTRNGKTYICINYHDYAGKFDFKKENFEEISLVQPDETKAFSYRISKLPHFNKEEYVEKRLNFSMEHNEYFFKIKVNPSVKTIFKNYPIVDFEMQLNAPVSDETKASLLPLLRNKLKSKSTTEGIDYLMHFVRYAFVYEPDTKVYGTEKRFTPEQTLLSENSDCDDRVALFYFLVKELYNIPMLVLAYPDHVTVAVKLDNPIGETITYNGVQYTFAEPTPQEEDLRLGQLMPKYAGQKSEVVYAFSPNQHL